MALPGKSGAAKPWVYGRNATIARLHKSRNELSHRQLSWGGTSIFGGALALDIMPITALVFQSIPEGIIIFSFGLAITGEYINFKRVLTAAVISSLISMLVRAVVPFGVHTYIGIVVIALLFYMVLQLTPKKSVIAALLSILMLIVIEMTMIPIVHGAGNIVSRDVLNNDVLRIVYAWPSLIIYLVITRFIYKRKLSLVKGSRVSNPKFVIVVVLLVQGVIVAILSQNMDYEGNYMYSVKILGLLILASSLFCIKLLWPLDKNTTTETTNRKI